MLALRTKERQGEKILHTFEIGAVPAALLSFGAWGVPTHCCPGPPWKGIASAEPFRIPHSKILSHEH